MIHYKNVVHFTTTYLNGRQLTRYLAVAGLLPPITYLLMPGTMCFVCPSG
jgi:hypothetical protein